ncbi:MAG: hypothetical protein ACUVWP_04555 [bacterium]
MKKFGIAGFILGALLLILGVMSIIKSRSLTGVIPVLIGISLILLGYFPNRVGLVIFGHACIVIGFILITIGLYLLPYAKPTFAYVFGYPLFWGLFSTGGGVCAIYHGFCKCFIKVNKE